MGKIMRNNLTKKAVAVILTLVLVLSGFGAIGVQPVHAADLTGTISVTYSGSSSAYPNDSTSPFMYPIVSVKGGQTGLNWNGKIGVASSWHSIASPASQSDSSISTFARGMNYLRVVLASEAYYIDNFNFSNYGISNMNVSTSMDVFDDTRNTLTLSSTFTPTATEAQSINPKSQLLDGRRGLIYALDLTNAFKLNLHNYNGNDGTKTLNCLNRDNAGVGALSIANNNKGSKTGWGIEGWYTDATLSNKIDSNTKLYYSAGNENMHLYAKWLPMHDVQFDSHGGTAVKKQSVMEGSYASKPADPKKEGFVFAGWFKDDAFSQAFTFESDAITAPITLHAKYNEDKNGDGIDDFGQPLWHIYIGAYPGGKVSYKTPHIVSTQPETRTDFYALPGEEVTVSAHPEDNYELEGWYQKPFGSFINPEDPFAGDAILQTTDAAYTFTINNFTSGGTGACYAVFKGVDRTVSFDANEGDGSKEDETVEHNKTFSLPPATTFTAPTGKVFDEWEVTIGTAEPIKKAPGDSVTITADTVVKALWGEDKNGDGTVDSKEEKHSVTYSYANAPADADALPTTLTDQLKYTKITVAGNPAAVEAYLFMGWEITAPAGVNITNGEFTMPDADVTILGTWKDDKNKDTIPDEDQPFTVTFNGNGKDFTSNKPADQSIVYGNKATRPTATPTAEKAIFDNWYKDQACSEAFNFDAEEITAGTTIWAGWFDDLNRNGEPDKDEDKYSIVYQYENAPQEGAWAPPLLPPTISGVEITISGSPAPVAGYLFKGWRVTSPATLVVENGKFMMPKETVTITGPWVKKNFNDNIKDEDGKPITPKEPLPSNPEPKEGDKFLDDKGNPWEIKDIGDTNPDTGDTPITVKPVPKTYNDVKDEDGNPVTPKPPFNDDDNKPEDGKKFLDDKGDPYEITEIGETDPETGDTPITVKPVPKNYDDVKDEEGNPVKPKEPLGKDGEEPEVGDRFEDENGDEYEITEVGPSDKDGNVPVKVGQVMTLTFNLDGGTLAGQTGMFTVKEVKNRSFVIPDEAPTKDGYDFLYWEGSRYDPGDTYVVKDNHKFTAKWIKETVTPKYTDVKDGDGKPVTPKEQLGGDGKTPKPGDRFTGTDGNTYEIVSVGEPNPDTGIATVVVKKVSGGSGGSGSGSGSTAAPTGDESNAMLWMMLLALAAIGTLFMRKLRASGR